MTHPKAELRLTGPRAHPGGGPEGPKKKKGFGRAEALAVAQGAFYTATGVWPILDLESFEAVTGPKPEGWLVKTVGGLLGVAGAALTLAGARKRVTPELALIGAGSAAVLAAIDVVYVGKRRISPVYLLDAVAEGALVAAWAATAREVAAEARSPGERAESRVQGGLRLTAERRKRGDGGGMLARRQRRAG
ncbi:MAG TPA: hypothetical protein VHG91_15330 [Longimicrobium sp.]|nr:hypothetical protein [Longimicrobium sp.]